MKKRIELKKESGLRSECLSFTEVIAQSISNIAPSATPAFTIPMVFALAGNGTWLTYVFATVAVLLIVYHINHFAKRSASPGNLYTYVGDALGSGAGFLSGWSLILAYLLTACATLAGFSNYLNVVSAYIGIKIPSILAFLIAITLAWIMVSRDVKVSAKLMLVLEGVSLIFIFTLGAIVLVKNGFKLDMAQIRLKGVSFGSIRLGLVMAFFSFVGFESATSLGAEAKKPLKNIPRSLITSAVFVGFIFVIFSYIEVMGFIGSSTGLNSSAAPLTYLATKSGFGFMGLVISIGATISFWSCVIACLTASARIVLAMSQDKILYLALGRTHKKHKTPYMAINLISVVVFIIPTTLSLFGVGEMNIFAYVGTVATLGFLFSYAMVVIGAVVYLRKRKELNITNIIISAMTMVLLLVPIVGSIYPLPAYPYNLFPFIFLGWICVGEIWFVFRPNTETESSQIVNEDIVAQK